MPEAFSPDWLSWAFWAQHHESIRDLLITAAALVGIPFVIWREWLHYGQTKAALRQADTAQYRHWAQVQADQERRITDNFTRAAELLGSDKLATRLGAIYALERIARESENDHWPIMETLIAYAHEHAPWPPKRKGELSGEGVNERAQPATDVQAILTVIGRRRREYEGPGQHLDLSEMDLRGCFLPRAHLQNVGFIETHLEHAYLDGAYLTGAILLNAHLQGAKLMHAHVKGALLEGAHLEGAWLVASDLSQEQFDSATTDENTEVPPHIKRQPQSSNSAGEAAQAQYEVAATPSKC